MSDPEKSPGDVMLFAEDAPAQTARPWKVLIVDDEEDIHAVTRLIFKKLAFEGRSVVTLSGHSGGDALRLLREHPDAAVLFLDVVMETETAGLDMVKRIREELGNRFVRIVLRTGQPGQLPPLEVINRYDINDYREKSSMTEPDLVMALFLALRTFRDIMALETMRKALDDAARTLRENSESLAMAQSIARFGSWHWDIGANRFICSEEVCRIMGLSHRQADITLDDFLERLHPLDARIYQSAIDKLFVSEETAVNLTYRIIRPDGEERVVREMGELFRDGSGSPVRLIATLRDITERARLEARNERAQQSRIAISAMLETGFAPLSIARQLEVAIDIILTIPWLAVLYKGSISLFDEQTGELVMTAQRNLAPDLLDACARIPLGHCLCGRAAQTRQLVFAAHLDDRHEIRYDGISPHGHYCSPILSQDHLLGVLNLYVPDGHAHDLEEDAFLGTISSTLASLIERRKMEEKLAWAQTEMEMLAHHDALTGLPNRLLFRELLSQNLSRARRENGVLAVMFMDLDRFKEVNDSHGHEVGDKLLVEVTKRVKKCCREGDTVARWGGDEFTLILPDVARAEHIHDVAKRIIETLCRPFHLEDVTCLIGTSIGISLFPSHGASMDELLKQADRAMYAVKDSGRNNYRFYKEGPEPQIDAAT